MHSKIYTKIFIICKLQSLGVMKIEKNYTVKNKILSRLFILVSKNYNG